MATTDPHTGGIPVDDTPPEAHIVSPPAGPAALESAANWATQADEMARRAAFREGQDDEAPLLRRAAAFAQVAAAHAAIAQACAEASRLLPVYAEDEPIHVDAWREVLS